MARDWRAELTGMEDTVDAQQIVDALKRHGYSKTDIAKALQEFMADNPTAGTSTPATSTKLTVAEVLEMIKDPSRHADLKARFDAMADPDKATLKAEVAKIIAAATQPNPDAAYNAALVQPVTNAVSKIESIVAAAIPKRTKMLDIIEVLNSIIPTPALQIKDETGVTYADKILKILSQNTDKFGTIATPGDKFVKLLTPSIQTNKRITLPQTALESQLRQLKKAAGII
jgi:hypothetical protein